MKNVNYLIKINVFITLYEYFTHNEPPGKLYEQTNIQTHTIARRGVEVETFLLIWSSFKFKFCHH